MALYNFPKQKVSDKTKATKTWQKNCIDGAVSACVGNFNSYNDLYDIQINFDLYNNKLNMGDVLKSINKDGLLGQSFPDQIENHPIMSPKIALLVGEELKRRFDFNVAVSSPNVITDKDRFIKKAILNRIDELSNPQKTPDMSKGDIEAEIKKLSRWKKYGYRDARELMVTNILHYYYEEQLLPTKFSRGFTDAIISNREFYSINIFDNKIVVDNIDPRSLFFIKSKSSMDIEDSDIIVHSSYETAGSIIDRYYEWLKPSEIDKLESLTQTPVKKTTGLIQHSEHYSESFDVVDFNSLASYDSLINSDGEIRVDNVMWKSRRKVGKLKVIDEDGNEDYKLVPEQYKQNKEMGEEIEWFWINEWWEGVRIYEDIYVKVRPRPIQFRGFDNISMSSPGIVGTIYPGASLVSKAKPYQYLYNIISYKIQKIVAKYKGPMIELDLAKIPEGWDMAKWFKIGDETGYLPIDNFKEGNKGAATGKLAGNFNTSGKEYNQNTGNYFNEMFGLLSHIDNSMGSIIGVSKQREGEIQNRETVGGVERAVTQSSHITEELFHMHDYTRLKVLKAIVENAKYLYKNKKSKVMQYLVDETSLASFEIDGDLINESDYSIMISNNQNITQLINSFKQLAPEGIKAGKMNFSNIMDVYISKSLAETRRAIEEFEERAEENARKQEEARQAQLKAQVEKEEKRYQEEQDLKKYEIDKNNENKLEIQREKNEIELKKLEQSEYKDKDLEGLRLS